MIEYTSLVWLTTVTFNPSKTLPSILINFNQKLLNFNLILLQYKELSCSEGLGNTSPGLKLSLFGRPRMLRDSLEEPRQCHSPSLRLQVLITPLIEEGRIALFERYCPSISMTVEAKTCLAALTMPSRTTGNFGSPIADDVQGRVGCDVIRARDRMSLEEANDDY
jgi:hypothetical protein